MGKPVTFARSSLTSEQVNRMRALDACSYQVPARKRREYIVWCAQVYWHENPGEEIMHLAVDFVFDDDGWVIPFLVVNGEMTTDVAPPFRAIRRDDLAALIDARLDPAEVTTRWEELEGAE